MVIAAARGATIAANAAVSIVAARLLGPEGTGALAIGLAFFSVLMLAAAAGLGVGAAWQVGAGDWSPRSALFSTQAAGFAIGSVVAAAGLGVFLAGRDNIFDGVPASGALAVLLAVPVALVWSHAANVAVAAERYRGGAVIPVVQAVAYLGCVATLAAVDGVRGALWGLLASQVVAALGAIAWGTRRFADTVPARALDLARVRRAIGFGATAWIGHVLAVAVQRGDLFLLSATGTREDVGHYAIAVAVTTPLWVLPSGLGSVLLPRMAALGGSHGEVRNHFEAKALRHGAALVIATAAVTAAGILALLPSIYGTAFEESRVPALILIPGTIALGVAFMATASLSGRGRPGDFLRTWLAVLPVSAVLYATLVPAYGPTGAASASSGSYILAALVSCGFLLRDRKRDREVA